eukprot:gnl/MRDRNA2_/MRDRNA2_54219_c0_seq1.p1 gnl/MRDRNA2_/MRDRNA2_54219_c0~~gnl/MRDRNA2_/MRDRNA2_54219_c0_seq1.p1  ORF type:complete len:143 (-),score=29.44 gnl/MRDRNA2_/MRDRNA2_54219_c0_seq1:144-572(-)
MQDAVTARHQERAKQRRRSSAESNRQRSKTRWVPDEWTEEEAADLHIAIPASCEIFHIGDALEDAVTAGHQERAKQHQRSKAESNRQHIETRWEWNPPNEWTEEEAVDLDISIPASYEKFHIVDAQEENCKCSMSEPFLDAL